MPVNQAAPVALRIRLQTTIPLTDRGCRIARRHPRRDRWARRCALNVPLTACLLLIGCGSPELADAVEQAIARNGVRNARLRTVSDLPTLRVTAYLVDDLDEAARQSDLQEMRARARRFLEQAQGLGLEASAREIERLPEPVLAGLWATCFPQESPPANLPETVTARLHAAGRRQHQAWVERIGSARSTAELARALAALRQRINPPAGQKERALRVALNWPVALSAAVAQAGANGRGPDRRAATPDMYEPDIVSAAAFAREPHNASVEVEFLLKFAPTIVQERLRRPLYDPALDRIGQVRLDRPPTVPQVRIDTESPSVYGYWQLTKAHGEARLQLVYVFWYPQRPPSARPSHDEGPINGLTLRITLDGRYRPAVFETVCCCGCGHRVWVAAFIEEAARHEFGWPRSKQVFAVQRPGQTADEWRVCGPVEVPPRPDAGPILLVRAGNHEPLSLVYDRSVIFEHRAEGYRRYLLRPYEELEHSAIAGKLASMFGPEGLVRGAVREHGWLMAYTGVLCPGQPRQRGTHLIGDGRDDFDDPHLLEKRLRLPSDF